VSICTGPEFGPAPTDGSLHVRNTQPKAWVETGTHCVPSGTSDLRKDPALGLWVPPVEFGCFYNRFDTEQLEQQMLFSSWFTALSVSIPSSKLPDSICSGQQFMAIATFTVSASVPQNAGLLWVASVGTTAPPAPNTAPPSNYLEHGRFKGYADAGDPAGTVFQMARTTMIQRHFYVAAGTAFTLYQWLAFNAFQNGTGQPLPTVNRVVGELLVYCFDAATGFTGGPE
jgi:hypothetical protein